MKRSTASYSFPRQLNTAVGAPPVPEDLRRAAETTLSEVSTIDEAHAAFARFAPELARHAPDAALFLACGMMLEKCRHGDGMLQVWGDLQWLFPEEQLPLRMLMRWYRRGGQLDEGLQRLHQIVPRLDSPARVRLRMLGYLELHLYAELDSMMETALFRFPTNRALRLKYIEILIRQDRVHEASRQVQALETDTLDDRARALLQTVADRAASLREHRLGDLSGVLGRIVETFMARTPRAVASDGIGPVVLFTGQLGAGGAERQMTRIAAQYRRIWDQAGGQLGRHRLLAPPAVCVRHASPASGSDFFLPILRDAGVDTTILTDLRDPGPSAYGPRSAGLGDLLDLLPEDILAHTRKLVPYFRARRFDAVYLWQDGGVLAAALAALLAEVPRIVTSFRGLPPNLRPELLRPQMPALYRALVRVPGVRYTANSAAVARAYEDWLDLSPGTIAVVHNVVPTPEPDGAPADREAWARITAASPECSRTVLGVFRFDANKRPDFWIECAADYLRRHADTRFVIVGTGHEFERCRVLRDAAGLQTRVFLPGVTRQVGFYLARADLVMHLARMEGLPNVLIEAQLAGVPVLATPAGGTPEIVADGETGRLLQDAQDPTHDAVTALLETMLGDPARLSGMGARARDRAMAQFEMNRMLEATLGLFAAPPVDRAA